MNTTQHTTGEEYNTPATQDVIERTMQSLENNGFIPHHVKTKEEALAALIDLVPDGVTIMNGTSATLHEIGFIDFLKDNKEKWNNLHNGILAEKHPAKQGKLRLKATISDYYTGSVHALTEEGELLIASNTGSQLPHLVNTSKNIILIVGSQKIVPTLSEAFKRLEERVIPLEDQRMKDTYGIGTTHAKTLIMHKENPSFGRKIHIVIVDEKLGF
jgi:L-lactate utilization protein LutB